MWWNRKNIGRFTYSRKQELGRGSFGRVFLGTDKRNDRAVAVKVLKGQDAEWENVRQEVGILALVQHENILNLLYYQEKRHKYYLVTDFCTHGSLRSYLRGHLPLPEEEIRWLLRQIVAGLGALRAINVVHRDLKPANVLLTRRRNREGQEMEQLVVKIADFGLSEILPVGQMMVALVGTPIYAAPEVFRGQPYDVRADLYSLGVMIYQWLADRLPGNPRPGEEIRVRFPLGTSVRLANLVMSLTWQNPDDRIVFDELQRHPFLAVGPIAQPTYQRPLASFERSKKKSVVAVKKKKSRSHNRGGFSKMDKKYQLEKKKD